MYDNHTRIAQVPVVHRPSSPLQLKKFRYTHSVQRRQGPSIYIHIYIYPSARLKCCTQAAKMPALESDLLNPDPAVEAKKHKLKRLVQSPNSYFMDVKCPGCYMMYVGRIYILYIYTYLLTWTCVCDCVCAGFAVRQYSRTPRASSCAAIAPLSYANPRGEKRVSLRAAPSARRWTRHQKYTESNNRV